MEALFIVENKDRDLLTTHSASANQTPTTSPLTTVEHLYQQNYQQYFQLLSYYIDANSAEKAQAELAKFMMQAIPASHYKKYAHLLAFRFIFDSLNKNPQKKIPLIFQNYSFEQSFCFLLKYCLHFSNKEIATVLSTSLGSIETIFYKIQKKSEVIEASRIFFTPVPEQLKTFPIQSIIERKGTKFSFNWQATPWYIKIFIESVLATSLVLAIVLSIPRIKTIYEFWLERRLDLYSIAELTTGINNSTSTESNNPEVNNEPLATVSATANSTEPNPTPKVATTVRAESEFTGKDSEKASIDKVYRIMVKTDSPDSTEPQISQFLGHYPVITEDRQSNLWSKLPGGIMFDFYLPISSYKKFVTELSAMLEIKVIITKTKDNKTIPGHTRVKLWLQRI